MMDKQTNDDQFESSVISYGCQTAAFIEEYLKGFESSVISYGCQTHAFRSWFRYEFESSVISYGCQTPFKVST